MDPATPSVADVFRRYGDTYRAQAGATLSTPQRRVMTAIERCRTAALGGHVEPCDHCGRVLALTAGAFDLPATLG